MFKHTLSAKQVDNYTILMLLYLKFFILLIYRFALAANFYWAVWSIIQERVSKISMNYLVSEF